MTRPDGSERAGSDGPEPPAEVVFHAELRQFPHVARAFNLGAEELRARIAGPWARGEVIELGEHRWAPERARLTILEGRRLREDEIGMGRGWANAAKAGADVTEPTLATLRSTDQPAINAALADFKRDVLAHTATGRIGLHQVLWLANAQHPGRRVSERLALAEQAVWELLHEHQLTMLRTGNSGLAGTDEPQPIARAQWQAVLLSWGTWSDPRAPSVLLERTAKIPG